ncbi:MAG: GSCFA domain-containing protein [Bacteroidales bacterium]|nr:GSCFA domain-containing protein [Bacteroidales bacterium]
MKKVKISTHVPVEGDGFTIGYDNSVMLIGSCFTERIGERLRSLRFDVDMNPFGILYNPLSMAETLSRCIDDSPIDDTVLFNHEGLWHSWLHHGVFSNVDKDVCLQGCNNALHSAHAFLQKCDTVILTFGSAWYYVLNDGVGKGMTVANCHKVPSACFDKCLASVDEVVGAWSPLVERLLSQGKRILFTVSPVRHEAYGAHGNQLGKAVLLLAIERLQQMMADREVYYFPAYEIVMDELRDYRYYADDLLHPSAVAEEIVWQRFAQAYFHPSTMKICEKVDQLNDMLAHRIMNPDSEAAKKFYSNRQALQDEIENLLKKVVVSQ